MQWVYNMHWFHLFCWFTWKKQRLHGIVIFPAALYMLVPARADSRWKVVRFHVEPSQGARTIAIVKEFPCCFPSGKQFLCHTRYAGVIHHFVSVLVWCNDCYFTPHGAKHSHINPKNIARAIYFQENHFFPLLFFQKMTLISTFLLNSNKTNPFIIPPH